jgi:hypothetical protein
VVCVDVAIAAPFLPATDGERRSGKCSFHRRAQARRPLPVFA